LLKFINDKQYSHSKTTPQQLVTLGHKAHSFYYNCYGSSCMNRVTVTCAFVFFKQHVTMGTGTRPSFPVTAMLTARFLFTQIYRHVVQDGV